MTSWFEDDDPRYLEWLAENPEGFVLSTHVQPSARYLLLHRAACPRVRLPLPVVPGSTPRFGKACASMSEALRAWAADVTGGVPRRCSLCAGDGG